MVPAQFPIFSIGDVVGTSNGADSFVQFQPRNVWTASGTLNHLQGKHSLKFGGEYRILDFNEAQETNASGIFSFGRTFTQGPNPVASSTTAGYGFASFLLGDVSSGSINAVNPISTRGLYGAIFVQDDWKVSSRLTLNIGLRWDLSTGDMEKYNRLAYFDPLAPNPLGPPAGLPNLTGLLKWVGKGNGNQQASTLHDFGPRFGLAYQLTHKTVLRGGYGLYYLPAEHSRQRRRRRRSFPHHHHARHHRRSNSRQYFVSNPYPQGILPPLNDRNHAGKHGFHDCGARACSTSRLTRRPGASGFRANFPGSW